ncbi:MAG: translation initiation factor IF-3 [Minisyncoccota bacterium]
MTERIRINNQIRVAELRVVTDTSETLGVLSFRDALAEADKRGLDLIEISPSATPPVAKIMDYGKFQYEQNKKQREAKSKSHITETKSLQVKIGTSEHDLELKAKNAAKWLREGHRVKIDLFLTGRSKYTEIGFKQERLDRVLTLIPEAYKIASGPEKSLKGLTVVIERSKMGGKEPPKQTAPTATA